MRGLVPDWNQRWTAEQAEHELADFKFNGPGLYHANDKEFMIVVAEERHIDTAWNHTMPSKEVFNFCVYTGDFTDSVFAVFCTIPTRN